MLFVVGRGRAHKSIAKVFRPTNLTLSMAWTFLSAEGEHTPASGAAVHGSTVLSELAGSFPGDRVLSVQHHSSHELILYNELMKLNDQDIEERLMQLSHETLAALYDMADFLEVQRLLSIVPRVIEVKLETCHDIDAAVEAYFGCLVGDLKEQPEKIVGQRTV
jgi:hypothetical protein